MDVGSSSEPMLYLTDIRSTRFVNLYRGIQWQDIVAGMESSFLHSFLLARNVSILPISCDDRYKVEKDPFWKYFDASTTEDDDGSVVWPGWGTLLGLGLGDGWASWRENDSNETFPQPASITDLYSLFLSTVWKSERKQRSTSKTQTSHCADDGGDDDDGDDDDNEYIGKELNEARLCGCCQIVTFSSNPYNHRLGDGGTPISSRTCGHSICKSCVQNCHVMVMERTMNYEEWMKCPMCNAPKAFHSQDHLINRSLCQVLAWIDGTYMSSKSTKS